MTTASATQASKPCLSVRGLRISLPQGADRPHAVDNISFDVRPGEVVCLLGESGSGKTVTALSLLRLVMNADLHGTASFVDSDNNATVDLLSIPEQQLRGIRGQDIAMIFQEPMTSLNPVFSVGEQIAESIRLHQGLSHAGALWLDMLAPGQLSEVPAHQLSAMRKKLKMSD